MPLSSDLISQFVKVTKDDTKTKKETIAYGTIVEENGTKYVRLDGSTISTPLTSAVDVDKGDRVTVMIKNHTATITGNLSNPSATYIVNDVSGDTEKVVDVISKFEIAIADKVSTKDFDAEKARIEDLRAKDVVIEKALIDKLDVATADIKYVSAEKLDAVKADIETLDAKKADISILESDYATIAKLDATNAEVHNLETTYAKVDGRLTAAEAVIDDLDANYAKVSELNATKGTISDLQSDVADIDTLIFGSAAGNTIQSAFANAVIAQLGDAQIKSAMIESVSADKITAGDIITNNVRVLSEDGKLIISDETIQISDNNRVRVQIGKDAENDYSINIWDADGNLMFSKGGITDKAIKSAIIRNDMVSENANIHASKLDINSLFSEINSNGSNTIKSTKIYLDDYNQTLDVEFKSLYRDLVEIGQTVTSQGTQISAVQGQISSKVWKQDIKTAVDDIEIGGRNYFIRKNINNLACGSGNTLLEQSIYRGYSFPVVEGEEWLLYRTDTRNNRWGFYWLDTEPIAGVSTAYIVMRDDSQAAGYVNKFKVPANITWAFIYLSNDSSEIPNIMLEKGNKASDWSPAPEDIDYKITTLSTQYSDVKQTVDSVSVTVASHTTELESKAGVEDVTEISDKVTEVEADLDGFKTTVSNKFNDYSTTTEVQSAIDQKADSITSSVRSTYATIKSVENVQNGLDTLEIGGRNYFITSKTVDLGCTGLASGEQSLIATGACIGFYVPVEEGDVWSLSRGSISSNRFDYCFTIDEPAAGVLIYGWNSGGRELLKIEGITVPVDSGYKYLFIYLSNQNDELDNVKLERGNRATDWTPAPEDMATAEEVEKAQSSAETANSVANSAETLIKQLSDSISTLVTDGNGTSLMTQTEDGWTFSTAKIQDLVNDISDNMTSLTTEVGGVNNTVDILQQAVADLGEIAEHVSITTFEDEPCIELGESDSEFKLRITNTRMIFTEGSSVLAYFNNQSFYVKKAVIEEELQQGNFVWKVRSNGNLGLTWKGGNN